jgi:hypothetical protein
VTQFQPHLREQRMQHRVERMAGVEVLAFLSQIEGPESHR